MFDVMKFEKETNTLILDIPNNLCDDLKRCLTLHPPLFDFTYNFDYFIYFISKIIDLKTFKRFKNLRKVPISSTVLVFELGKNYKRYLEYLIEHKFIETDNHYIVGDDLKDGKCKCYGIVDRYTSQKIVKYEIKKKSILKKFLEWKEEKFGKITNDAMMSKLYTMLQKVTVDIEGVKEFLNESVKNKKISAYKAKLELLKCERINNKEEDYRSIFLTKDSYGRIHSNFTNISKEIRKRFLYMDGEQLQEIDIVSSQPAMLYVVLKKYFDKVVESYKEKIENNYSVDDNMYVSNLEIPMTGLDPREKYVNNSNSYEGDAIFVNKFNPAVSKFDYKGGMDFLDDFSNEMIKYKDMLQWGIYEFFEDQYDRHFFGVVNRSDIKKQFIQYIFGQNDNYFTEQMDILWEVNFPILRKIIKHFKTGSHKPLSHELQRTESDIVFNKLCPLIDDLQLDYLTIHDSISVKRSELEKVYSIFNDVLEENEVVSGISY